MCGLIEVARHATCEPTARGDGVSAEVGRCKSGAVGEGGGGAATSSHSQHFPRSISAPVTNFISGVPARKERSRSHTSLGLGLGLGLMLGLGLVLVLVLE